MPTRSLKALWPLMAGVISLRRKSATALISSVGVGSSCIYFPLGASSLSKSISVSDERRPIMARSIE